MSHRSEALDLVKISDDTRIPIVLPEKARAMRPIWSADGERFAFRIITAKTVDIWTW